MIYDWLYILLGIILLPGIVFATAVQAKLKKTYSEYNKVFSSKNVKAHQMARAILDAEGLQNVKIARIKGNLTDNYNSKTKTLSLSDGIYDSSSLSALGVAAHEIGHAIQDKEKYKPMGIRKLFINISNFASKMLIPLIILSIVFMFLPSGYSIWITVFASLGIGSFGISVLINLITLPVEYDASRRAREILLQSGLLNEEEVEPVKKVLNAAALTYVASLIVSVLSFIRIVLWFLIKFGKNRD